MTSNVASGFSGTNVLDSCFPAGAPWNLTRTGMFGEWTKWMLHPRGQDKVVAVLEAYIDESGINRTDRYCVVAGFVGSSKQWQLFEERWQKASGGVDFHGTEFFRRTKTGARVRPYKGWSDDQATTYLDGLLDVIKLGWLTPIGLVIDQEDFFQLTVTERHYLTGRMFHRRKNKWTGSGTPDKPWFLGFIECLMMGANCVRKPGLRVSFVFDQQKNYAPHALRLFQANKEHVPFLNDRLGECVFKPRAGIGGLQAADLLAHACHRRGRQKVGQHDELDRATLQLRPITHKKIPLATMEGFRNRLRNVPDEVSLALKWNA